ncbi:XRE family transcriptional regulator [Actinobacteria bacterium YIM 96077]|uniref:Transcriptional regulator n=2 Tax=Phytoactinopolyspora halophila TaxID=1981511 RepID=A0A329QD14_9ACTN|nr:XRE family transcriptional regulator [Actinobacteria bacterium YIM 96077]RAW10256.1 transcriptional regulator [Phytoactinopolyspora halophila]
MSSNSASSIASDVGRNIRCIRRAAGSSLAELASAADISKTTLHGIEQGEANPTLGTLWALATALRVSLGELLEQRQSTVNVVRANEGPYVSGDAVHARLLHRIPVRGSVDVFDLRIDPRRQVSQSHAPGVQECLVVTRGRIATGPAEDPADLQAGDSIRFVASSEHSYEGVEDDNHALLLMIHPDDAPDTPSAG